MAINPQAFHPQAPAFARSRPDAYYAWLTSNGFPYQEAYNQTTAIFGAPKTPEQQQQEAAKQQQQAGLAQTGGAIGGALLAQEGLRGFPTIGGLFSSGAGATTAATGAGTGTAGSGAVAMPTLLGGGGAVPTAAAPGAATTTGASTLSSAGSVALPVAAVVAAASNAWETGMKGVS